MINITVKMETLKLIAAKEFVKQVIASRNFSSNLDVNRFISNIDILPGSIISYILTNVNTFTDGKMRCLVRNCKKSYTHLGQYLMHSKRVHNLNSCKGCGRLGRHTCGKICMICKAYGFTSLGLANHLVLVHKLQIC